MGTSSCSRRLEWKQPGDGWRLAPAREAVVNLRDGRVRCQPSSTATPVAEGRAGSFRAQSISRLAISEMAPQTRRSALLKEWSTGLVGRDVVGLESAESFIPRGTRLYVGVIDSEDLTQRVAAAGPVRRLGFVPVPVIAPAGWTRRRCSRNFSRPSRASTRASACCSSPVTSTDRSAPTRTRQTRSRGALGSHVGGVDGELDALEAESLDEHGDAVSPLAVGAAA